MLFNIKRIFLLYGKLNEVAGVEEEENPILEPCLRREGTLTLLYSEEQNKALHKTIWRWEIALDEKKRRLECQIIFHKDCT